MTKIILKKNTYYLLLNNRIMFTQEVSKSVHIPQNMSPKLF
jgi:hypothetical protein